MRTRIFQVDAFASRRFAGNPAAVVPLADYPPDDLLQAVAAENNLPETAFLVADSGDYRLRWFTPTVEVPLCGHATLASSAVVMQRLEPGRTTVVFHTASGPLTVRQAEAGYAMDFPAQPASPVETPPKLVEALGVEPAAVLANPGNYLALLEDEHAVRNLVPDMMAIAALDRAGVCVTAPGTAPYDFVSRYFAPAKGIPEDPVTGGTHCMLTPYWAKRLSRDTLRATQASARGGEIRCRAVGDRVELRGECVFYLEGDVDI
jgi:PhzF family phenazine biosynthesis protein